MLLPISHVMASGKTFIMIDYVLEWYNQLNNSVYPNGVEVLVEVCERQSGLVA